MKQPSILQTYHHVKVGDFVTSINPQAGPNYLAEVVHVSDDGSSIHYKSLEPYNYSSGTA
tara:strand:+ start:3575 stop:3754 length:180 start_codon:yes stop_codon:yes gene_type:complete